MDERLKKESLNLRLWQEKPPKVKKKKGRRDWRGKKTQNVQECGATTKDVSCVWWGYQKDKEENKQHLKHWRQNFTKLISDTKLQIRNIWKHKPEWMSKILPHIQPQKIKYKEKKYWKLSGGGGKTIYIGAKIKSKSMFFLETMKTRREWSESLC